MLLKWDLPGFKIFTGIPNMVMQDTHLTAPKPPGSNRLIIRGRHENKADLKNE